MRRVLTEEMIEEIIIKFFAFLPESELPLPRISVHFEKAYFFFLDSNGLTNKFDEYDRRAETLLFCDLIADKIYNRSEEGKKEDREREEKYKKDKRDKKDKKRSNQKNTS